MSINRREFFKISTAMAATPLAFPGHETRSGPAFDPLNENGIHPVIAKKLRQALVPRKMLLDEELSYKYYRVTT